MRIKQSTTSYVLLTIFLTNMWASVASSDQARAAQQVWEVALGSCLSRSELHDAILTQPHTLRPSNIEHLLMLLVYQHKNSAGVPFWCRGSPDLAPHVIEACPMLHINMHILNDTIQLYLCALRSNYFTPTWGNNSAREEFVLKVKMLLKNELNSTKSSPRAQFLAEYQL